MNDYTGPTDSDVEQLADVIGIRRGAVRGEAEPATCRITYTVPEVSALLGISCATTYMLLRTGQIPARRVGSRWIIARRLFNAWLDQVGDIR